jgi:hypothetical protein
MILDFLSVPFQDRLAMAWIEASLLRSGWFSNRNQIPTAGEGRGAPSLYSHATLPVSIGELGLLRQMVAQQNATTSDGVIVAQSNGIIPLAGPAFTCLFSMLPRLASNVPQPIVSSDVVLSILDELREKNGIASSTPLRVVQNDTRLSPDLPIDLLVPATAAVLSDEIRGLFEDLARILATRDRDRRSPLSYMLYSRLRTPSSGPSIRLKLSAAFSPQATKHTLERLTENFRRALSSHVAVPFGAIPEIANLAPSIAVGLSKSVVLSSGIGSGRRARAVGQFTVTAAFPPNGERLDWSVLMPGHVFWELKGLAREFDGRVFGPDSPQFQNPSPIMVVQRDHVAFDPTDGATTDSDFASAGCPTGLAGISGGYTAEGLVDPIDFEVLTESRLDKVLSGSPDHRLLLGTSKGLLECDLDVGWGQSGVVLQQVAIELGNQQRYRTRYTRFLVLERAGPAGRNPLPLGGPGDSGSPLFLRWREEGRHRYGLLGIYVGAGAATATEKLKSQAICLPIWNCPASFLGINQTAEAAASRRATPTLTTPLDDTNITPSTKLSTQRSAASASARPAVPFMEATDARHWMNVERAAATYLRRYGLTVKHSAVVRNANGSVHLAVRLVDPVPEYIPSERVFEGSTVKFVSLPRLPTEAPRRRLRVGLI